ncbi:hypothetical protein E2P81_ATG03308 [Venturia nashicola]|uniref:Uncharacterized protein n=1 Tax=Venturia nashicola TaxID=86259 RepID=A0A4Z1PEY9_9PEZI|nr:hypothetical protein E6O75_ATG03377 [Venturia nashicola]TLD36419.1 hypothetical protein E2P81_ATG03308 [Venturia nashicola]
MAASTTEEIMAATKYTMPFLNLPTEIRQQILLQVITDEYLQNTIELKAYKAMPDAGLIPRYEAKWQARPIPSDRPTSPRVMCPSIISTTSPLVDFACRWNVPAPLFMLDHVYIDQKWKERQDPFGVQKVDAWNHIFGSQFHINWVENFLPYAENGRTMIMSREVSPLGSNTFIQGGGKRHRVQPPPGMVSDESSKMLGTAVRRHVSCIIGYSWKIHVKGFIEVDVQT